MFSNVGAVNNHTHKYTLIYTCMYVCVYPHTFYMREEEGLLNTSFKLLLFSNYYSVRLLF